MIPQIEPYFGDEERWAVNRYMVSGAWLTEHTRTRALERAIASMVNVRYCFMVPNCTLALYAALTCLDIGPGDEVIVPAYTMVATANAVRMTGAVPVFVDVAEDLCLDLDLVDEAITVNTAAVIVVSLNGRSPDMRQMRAMTASSKLLLVEDAAQAFGSRHDSQHLGTFGDFGCYSFSPHKIVSTGQGGCIVTDYDVLADRLHCFRNFGRTTSGGHDHDTFGINLKFTDLQAVVGLEQLKRMSERMERKRALFELYQQGLEGLPIRFIPTDLNQTVPWYVDIFLGGRVVRGRLVAFLREKGIGTQVVYPAVPDTGAYRSYSGLFSQARLAAATGLWLPSSVTLRDEQVGQVCDAIQEFFKKDGATRAFWAPPVMISRPPVAG